MRLFFIPFMLFFFISSVAQDTHFSQFTISSFLLNPALVGVQKADYKLTLQRKSQWESIGIPFKTLTFSFEKNNLLNTNSIGAQFINDIAGDSRFKTSGFNIAYSKRIITNTKNSFAIGAELGFFQRSIIFDNLIFIEPENLSNLNFLFTDINLGIANFYKLNDNSNIESGIAVYHINKPNQSLFSYEKIPLNPKINFHLRFDYIYSYNLSFHPKVLLTEQYTESEFIFGCDVNYLLNNQQDAILKLGIADRLDDAIIFSFGLEIESLSCVVSYDINTSSLSEASNREGGLEVSLLYTWNILKNRRVIENEKCPKYL